ncbi:hypothetical protein ColLi_12953 [Colletotrichum liriopes]|uniref:Uncharacterized protein n=1 Tax=Colletotrichum liriopes TaxID=708192 RepID=A0AA37LYA6_9PEZI|nr:hypothetical protein ColLi_12953 [Colletotrichum liriopes]
MANLLSASDISALYITRTKQLVLDAKVPGFILGPKFERVKGFVGGLRFALVGFPGGFGRQPESQAVTDKIHISLPAPHFNNETVLIDTAEGLQIIKIKYTGLKDEALAAGLNFVTQQEKSGSTGTIARDSVLPISALIPKADGDSKVSVDISFNEEFLRLVNASAHDGTINWSFKWAKIPTEEGQNPQLINVNTTIWNGIVGPLANTSLNVQGYIVHFVELQK